MGKHRHGYMHWDKVIFALLKHKTYKKAAAALGVSRVTVWRYTQIPEFRRRWLQAQASVYSEARAELEEHANEAVAVVIQIMNDPKTKPADRLRASGYILGMRPTGLPLDDVELSDFETDAPGFESDIPMEPPLFSIDRACDGGHSSESGEPPDQPLTSEQRVAIAEFVEELIARQSVSAESPKTATAAGAVIEPVRTFSPAGNPSTHPAAATSPIQPPHLSTQTAAPAVVGRPAPAETSAIQRGRPPHRDLSTDPAPPVGARAQSNSSTNLPTATVGPAGRVPEQDANRRIAADVIEAQRQARESIQAVLESDQRHPPR